MRTPLAAYARGVLHSDLLPSEGTGVRTKPRARAIWPGLAVPADLIGKSWFPLNQGPPPVSGGQVPLVQRPHPTDDAVACAPHPELAPISPMPAIASPPGPCTQRKVEAAATNGPGEWACLGTASPRF